ncbi:MAG: outer membrane beta-barrel protein [bacterium]|nr:outer membrane beta-barrel protein [bacterium]
MNKKVLSLSLAALVLASANANAFYVGAGVGTSKAKFEDVSLDRDAAFSIYTGMSIPLPLIPIRGEIELMNLKSSKDEIDGKVYGAAANAYVGLPLLPIVKPYVGMGLAYAQAKFSDDTGSYKSDWKVVPQYMLGLDLSLPLIPVAGGVEYRYMDADFDGKDFGDGVKTKVHTIMMKGRFHF